MTVSAERPRLLVPGLLPADPALERYRVHPGAVTAVELDPGDVLTVIDEEGRQRGELTVLAGGAEDYRALGTEADTAATVLRTMTARSGVIGSLAGRGLDPGQARAVALFGEWSPAGTRAEFTARRSLTAVVAAPGGPMSVAADNPPSDLVLEVRRVSPRRPEQRSLPPPLADPLLDLRVDTATARSYEVKAGQYIQVIDVEGRQCSDFLAFGERRLDDGVERGLDSTTTRYLMGNAYPQPGLFGKFYDADAQPLVEIVQDTVGRHDTFGLACNAKYYEDMGYPGHISCTENFNNKLAGYGIAARAGWPALNLFYNTAFDANNVLVFDEPWSRPGDYVLMRAATDLV
ncbi:MAG: DUF1989 domain-containing protein, partial [Streptosporangiaceae bacterium]